MILLIIIGRNFLVIVIHYYNRKKLFKKYMIYEKPVRINMKKILIALIKFYRKFISPMKGTKCPYIPTCSEYGLEAIQKHGALKGSMLAIYRILRCNPFSKGGYDPVP